MYTTVVIIDSGIDINHPELKGFSIEGYVYKNHTIVKSEKDEIGHGTAIAKLITKYGINVRIIGIRIALHLKNLDDSHLIEVLTYVHDNIETDLINLSLGVNICLHNQELYNICKKIYDKGIIIVAAFDNDEVITYPAAYNCVIGVKTGQRCKNPEGFEYYEDSVVNLGAYGRNQRIKRSDGQFSFLGGTSLACAMVTARITRFRNIGLLGLKEILGEFESVSIYKEKVSRNNAYVELKLPKIQEAVLFPFNKEMHSFVRFKQLLSFEIVAIYDIKYSGIIGATTRHILKDDTVSDYIVKNLNNLDWDEFDTIIIGHLESLSNIVREEELLKRLLLQAMEHKKRVITFDDISYLLRDINIKEVYFPIIDKSMIPPPRFGMLNRFSKHIIGVWGTSSRQGKFTLQLKIREHLIEKGYKVGQIATEPSALLFGIDYCFPMGYNSSVYIQGEEVIFYLNNIMQKICENDVDIIIVGSQSGTVTYDFGNINQYNLKQFEFLVATQPDAIVLCINPYDDFNYIQRSINFIESSVECKVISLVVFPMTLESGWKGALGNKRLINNSEFLILKELLEDNFNYPVLRIDKEMDVMYLVDNIINFFSE